MTPCNRFRGILSAHTPAHAAAACASPRPLSLWHCCLAALLALLCLLLAAPAGAFAADAPTAPTAIAATAPAPAPGDAASQPRGITPYKVLQNFAGRLTVMLPNRLVVILQEIHTTPMVTVQAWVKTGSIYEQKHAGAGLSHYLEHLISAGSTATRTEKQTNEILGRIGAQTNASTSLDNVNYYITTTAPYTAQAVDLLSDWLQHAQIRPEEFEREKQVIQREFSMGDGEPGRIFWKLTQQARYRAHPARHPTIGYLDEFLQISRDDVYNFYIQMYAPNNIVFAVSGDFDKEAVLAQISKLWDSPARDLPALDLPNEPQLDGPTRAAATATVTKPRLRLAWPGTRLGGDGDYALDLLAVILGQGESSRLVREVRDQQRLVDSITAYNLSHHWGEGFFGIDAQVAEAGSGAQVDSVQQAILLRVLQVQTQGVSADELARAKKQILAAVIYSNQDAQAIGGRLASDFIATGDPDYLQRYAQKIQTITPLELQAAANRFLQPQRLITLTLLPVPKGQEQRPLTRPEDSADQSRFPREPVHLDNMYLVNRFYALQGADLTAPQASEAGPVTRTVLANGLRLLVQRNTQVPAVAMQFYLPGGLLSDSPGQEGLANAAATMLIKGAAGLSAQDIARQMEDLGAELSSAGGNNSIFVQADCLSADLPAVLEMFARVTLKPTFPADEWGKLQPRLLAAIDSQKDVWNQELGAEFRQAYYGSHPWAFAPVGRRDAVAAFTPADLARYYHEHLAASAGVLAIFGDVDPQQVTQLAEKLFADMPLQPVQPFQPPAPPVPQQAKVVQQQTNKLLAAVKLGFSPGISRIHADYPAMSVLGSVLSSFPAGYLEEALRGQGPGLVYAVGAGSVVGLIPGYFSVAFNTQPETIHEALRRTLDVIDRVHVQNVDAQTLARAKAAVLTSEFEGKQSNSGRAMAAALDEMYGLPPDQSQLFLRQVEAVTAADLRRVAKKHLQNPLVLVLTNKPVSIEQLQALVAHGVGEGRATR